jgi:hypothetical protein
MNNKAFLHVFLAFVHCASVSVAQTHHPDEWWPIGTTEFAGTPEYGQAWLHFQNGVPVVQPASLQINFEATAAVATDTAGQVLFYSNGCEIRNADGNLIQQGDGLNPGTLHDWVCNEVGYTAPRSMTAIQIPGHAKKWMVIHLGGQYDPSRKLIYGPLYITEVDMAANNGQGEVTQKNQIISTGELEPFSIVRHGNGRDWWVVMPEYNTNRYQIRLLSPAGLALKTTQDIGPTIGCRRVGASTFSPDGSKFARTNSCAAVVMDFDRCSGVLSNPVPLQRDEGLIGGGGVVFSTDNKWLYATSNLCIFRADLTTSTPFLDSLYKWPYEFLNEPPISNYVYGTSLTYMQQAPDGRIYMGSRHRDRYYPTFTILEDDGYAFEPEGLKTSVPIVRTLPHFPNFRLYDVPNSICDTLGIDTPINTTTQLSENEKIQIIPNPFDNELILTIPEQGLLRVWGINGQQITSKTLNTGQNHIDTHSWPTGMYSWIVILNNRKLQSGKILKTNQH